MGLILTASVPASHYHILFGLSLSTRHKSLTLWNINIYALYRIKEKLFFIRQNSVTPKHEIWANSTRLPEYFSKVGEYCTVMYDLLQPTGKKTIQTGSKFITHSVFTKQNSHTYDTWQFRETECTSVPGRSIQRGQFENFKQSINVSTLPVQSI